MFNPPRSAGSALLLATVPCQGTARSGNPRGGSTPTHVRHDWDKQTDVFGTLLGRVALLESGNLGAALLDPFTRHRTRTCRAISAKTPFGPSVHGRLQVLRL